MHTAPQPRDPKSNAPLLTRLQVLRRDLKDDEYEPPMPPIDAGAHVLDYFMEIGPVMSGQSVVTHEEIGWWQRNTGVRLQPWEARFIRALSQEYAAEMVRAEDPKATAPWQPQDLEVRRATVAAQIDSFMTSLTE